VTLSVTAPPPQEAGGSGGGAQGANGRLGGEEPSGGTPIQVVPGRLDAMKWPVLGILLAGFVAGGILLSRKSVVVPSPDGAAMQASALPQEASKEIKTATSAPARAGSLASFDKEAAVSLDSLKDLIFKLELRRQAGTISEEEYTAERARAEQILRDLVRG
jgi:hypothetical protein